MNRERAYEEFLPDLMTFEVLVIIFLLAAEFVHMKYSDLCLLNSWVNVSAFHPSGWSI